MSPITALIILLGLAVTANANNCPNLATAANFTVSSYSGVTNVGYSVITGNLGVYVIPSVTAFGPGIVTGGIQLATAAAEQAQIDETAAYNYCKNLSPTTVMASGDLTGLTLAPGVLFRLDGYDLCRRYFDTQWSRHLHISGWQRDYDRSQF
jgi:hypothetical protein